MSKQKGFCYKNDCGPIVQTGFHHEQYFVCKLCKEEITPMLKEQIEDRNKRKIKEEKSEDPDQYLDMLEAMNHYHDPLGD